MKLPLPRPVREWLEIRRSPSWGWGKLVERCRSMEQHYNDILRDERDMYLDEVGEYAVLRCLQHRFQLTSDEREDFATFWREERRSPIGTIGEPFKGHIRAYPEDPEDKEWASTAGLDAVAERVLDRFQRLYEWKSTNIFAFTIDYAHGEGDESDLGTTGLSQMRVGNTGWLVTGEYTENESYRELVLASWNPFDDAEARKRTIIDTYLKRWADCDWAPFYGFSAVKGWGEGPLLVDCLMAMCLSDSTFGRESLFQSIAYRAERLASLDDVEPEIWRNLDVGPPDDSVWAGMTAESLDQRRHDEKYLRPIIGAYLADLMHRRRSNGRDDG